MPGVPAAVGTEDDFSFFAGALVGGVLVGGALVGGALVGGVLLGGVLVGGELVAEVFFAELFVAEPSCVLDFLVLRRCLVFLENTLVNVLRIPFPTRRTAFVTRRSAPFRLRCLLERGLALTASVGTGPAGVTLGAPPREKNFLTRRVALRTPFLAARLARRNRPDNFFSCFFILFTCVKNNHPVPCQRLSFYPGMPRPSLPLQQVWDQPCRENERPLLSLRRLRGGHRPRPP